MIGNYDKGMKQEAYLKQMEFKLAQAKKHKDYHDLHSELYKAIMFLEDELTLLKAADNWEAVEPQVQEAWSIVEEEMGGTHAV